jgi:hypothetical protein
LGVILLVIWLIKVVLLGMKHLFFSRKGVRGLPKLSYSGKLKYWEIVILLVILFI